MHNNDRILFLGTPYIASKILKYLIDEGYNIIGVISQVDKEKDRKGNFLYTNTKKVAIENNINVYQYEKIKEHVDEIKELKPDLILTIAYGQIVPQSILDIPSKGCLNLHGSLLPKYRGAAPIQRALLNGEKETGFCLMEMVKKMDAGGVYAQEKIDINEEDNYTSLVEKLIECCKVLINKNLDKYLNGELIKIEQDECLVTYAPKIEKEDELLSLKYSCAEFINHVKALSYVPGGYLFFNNEKLKIFKCEFIDNLTNENIGTISYINKKLTLQLKDGHIGIIELQLPGKKILNYKDFLNGHKDLIGTILKDVN